jgi:hypothetical protein
MDIRCTDIFFDVSGSLFEINGIVIPKGLLRRLGGEVILNGVLGSPFPTSCSLAISNLHGFGPSGMKAVRP